MKLATIPGSGHTGSMIVSRDIDRWDISIGFPNDDGVYDGLIPRLIFSPWNGPASIALDGRALKSRNAGTMGSRTIITSIKYMIGFP
jgi:hypothetical protein